MRKNASHMKLDVFKMFCIFYMSF